MTEAKSSANTNEKRVFRLQFLRSVQALLFHTHHLSWVKTKPLSSCEGGQLPARWAGRTAARGNVPDKCRHRTSLKLSGHVRCFVKQGKLWWHKGLVTGIGAGWSWSSCLHLRSLAKACLCENWAAASGRLGQLPGPFEIVSCSQKMPTHDDDSCLVASQVRMSERLPKCCVCLTLSLSSQTMLVREDCECNGTFAATRL